MSKHLQLLIVSLVAVGFFAVGLLTLSDYGINWDESFHFQRGQAYLYYFLTGKKDYLDLPAYPKLRGTSDFIDRAGVSPLYENAVHSTKPPDPNVRRSYYQSDVFNARLLETFDGGHPPTSDILAAFFNYIFYQRLGIAGDIESYHIYELIIASLLILAVGIFSYRLYGFIPAVTASLTLTLYPLFFAESHFNIKDPPQAAFFGLTITSFYFGVIKNNWKLIVISAIFAGLALGTKFNIIFIPLIIGPWLLLRIVQGKTKFSKTLFISFIISPFVVLTVFFLFWPFLWNDTWTNFLKVLDYYQGIGMGVSSELDQYRIYNFNTYPLLWILYTTPVPVLLIVTLGIGYLFTRLLKKKDDIALLIILWFLVPILRVSIFNTNIYGGIRQIMEFIPALAIISGAGALLLLNAQHVLENTIGKQWNKVVMVFILVMFSFLGWELFLLHPNQNVYFNQLIGGLSGAREKNLPSWGNTYGNVYLQGVKWLNDNAEKDAKVGLPIAVMTNVPRMKLRPDIYFSNSYPSGPARQGEYVMEMAHDWQPKKWYGFDYYDKFLTPVYEVKVDWVPLLKIWKNDLAHTKAGFDHEQEYKLSEFKLEGSIFTADIGKEILLTKLVIKHEAENCQNRQVGGYIRLSVNRTTWIQEPETIDYPQIPKQWLGSDEKTFVYLFAAKKARFVRLDTEMPNSCILKNLNVQIFGLSS